MPLPRVRPVRQGLVMLDGHLVSLRELRREDVSVLHAAFAGDPAMHALVDVTPWRPDPLARRLQEFDRRVGEPLSDESVRFAVQRRDDGLGRCVGWGTVWGIDQHNRTAHLGVALIPDARGHGLGADLVDVLCRYAFVVRDLHRVSIETLATNEAMQRAALAAGFEQEGRLRESAYILGERVDELVFGQLAAAWRARTAG